MSKALTKNSIRSVSRMVTRTSVILVGSKSVLRCSIRLVGRPCKAQTTSVLAMASVVIAVLLTRPDAEFAVARISEGVNEVKNLLSV